MKLTEQRDVPTVYEPAEDSHLLAETAIERIDGGYALEVGVGSGYVASRIATETNATVVGSDISPEACARARAEGIETIRGGLTRPFRADSFDVVVFNPPYLPTPPDAEWDDPLEYALSGGPDGRRVVRPFVADVGRVLKPDGRSYLLVSSLTDIDAVAGLAADAGLTAREIAAERFPFERLVVLKITHKNS
jgi:release factor glutamine methyltransferase